KTRHIQKKLEFSPLRNNHFSIDTDLEDSPITISYNKFVPDAIPEIIDDEKNGKPLLQMMVTSDNGRETIFLEKGEVEQIGSHKHRIGFEVEEKGIINLTEKDGRLQISAPLPINFFGMDSQQAGILKADSLQPMNFRYLYRLGDLSFVPMSYHKHGKIN